jgi:cytochrome c556
VSRILAALLSSCLLLAACSSGEAPDTRPGQPVAHRRAAFKDLLKAFEPIGVMMRDGPYKAERFRQLVDGVMAQREAPWQYFQPDTLYPPSLAKPEVWSDAAGFVAAKKRFIEATDKLAAAAKTTDEDQSRAAFKEVEAACQNCHKTYKTKR